MKKRMSNYTSDRKESFFNSTSFIIETQVKGHIMQNIGNMVGSVSRIIDKSVIKFFSDKIRL